MRVHIIEGARRRHPLRVIDFRLTRQYWYPVVLAQPYLREQGTEVRFYDRPEGKALDCDVLILSSRQHDYLFGTTKDPIARARSVAALAARAPRLIWFDLRDSSGTPQFEVLPSVTLYVKQMLLREMSGYERPPYGGRVFADYYHRRFNATDGLERGSDDQEESFTALDPRWRHKVVLGWDVSYDYRRHWTTLTDQLRNSAQEAIRLRRGGPPILDFHEPRAERDYDFAAMFSVDRYSRNSVAYQRRLALKNVASLGGKIVARKVPRRDFVSVLRRSKIVLSCFGNGEVCYREHEAWVAGAAVIMPDMSHIRTWPNRYRDGDTYKAINWDLDDLGAAYSELVENRSLRERLAVNGQMVMRDMFSEMGLRRFAARFRSIVEGNDPGTGPS